MAKPAAKSSAKDARKSGKAKDLPAKSLKADQAASVKGGFSLSPNELKIHKTGTTLGGGPTTTKQMKFFR